MALPLRGLSFGGARSRSERRRNAERQRATIARGPGLRPSPGGPCDRLGGGPQFSGLLEGLGTVLYALHEAGFHVCVKWLVDQRGEGHLRPLPSRTVPNDQS